MSGLARMSRWRSRNSGRSTCARLDLLLMHAGFWSVVVFWSGMLCFCLLLGMFGGSPCLSLSMYVLYVSCLPFVFVFVVVVVVVVVAAAAAVVVVVGGGGGGGGVDDLVLATDSSFA